MSRQYIVFAFSRRFCVVALAIGDQLFASEPQASCRYQLTRTPPVTAWVIPGAVYCPNNSRILAK
jgi:hypothetical protein